MVLNPRNHRNQHSRAVPAGSVLFLGRTFEDLAEVAVQRGGDLAALGAWRERDVVDQGADGFCRFVTLPRML